MKTLWAGAGIFVCIAVFNRLNPALALQRLAVNLRAVGYLAADMADGAMSRAYRWREHVERARRET